ncbi:hypothetical protein DICPUDRAFT_27789 [Dictyostelium purpureum]|uniref:CHY-type domain-containing protein n=1 Tax=Dictyostelium purpureum TaxID=5786 RepID=F0ZAS2_DICPU|nr:uncharacterized protein DICPUDRAFT_27789 [Dictyostelium purpureum]EGC38935.1 hypothetical protein DICPUDRAFT_27789 [Dictyostelium purpureum]|eukprot:XP_003284500.1 hypothetical protein DICPUDRAFT_27789 [Dictyostelium purpureum]
MCKHILNVQVQIRAVCCKKWFDCHECHREVSDHEIYKSDEIVFACKKCKKVFRKNLKAFEEADEYCPHCDNHYYLDAVQPKAKVVFDLDGDERTKTLFHDPRQQRMDKSMYDGQVYEQ